MATPAFIYAFDNLSPDRFTELCGLLLAARFKGFLLGGVGPDGGVDGEIAEPLGSWQPEDTYPLLNTVIRPQQTVIFQFKHKATARVGQVQSRRQLLDLYKSTANRKSEIKKELIIKSKPAAYVLVTNVEINSEFRNVFIQQCKKENPNISSYQVIGLDDLETWVSMEMQIRHLYFPTIFGVSRFDLKIQLSEGFAALSKEDGMPDLEGTVEMLTINILNVGLVSSYVGTILFRALVDGQSMDFAVLNFSNPILSRVNPSPGTPVEPGRRQVYYFFFELLKQIEKYGKEVYPIEIIVKDVIGNSYYAQIPDDIRQKLKSS